VVVSTKADMPVNSFRRITRYEEWCNLVEDSESEDDEAVSHGRNNEARGTIIVRPPCAQPKADQCASKYDS
jgi:hypothetical protein